MEKFDIYLIVSLLIFFGISLTIVNYKLYKLIINSNKLFKDELIKKSIENEFILNTTIDGIKTQVEVMEHRISQNNIIEESKLISDIEKLFQEKINKSETPL